jgi:hypothetical protein
LDLPNPGRASPPLTILGQDVEAFPIWTAFRVAAILSGRNHDAGVTQLVECLLPKQNVVGSSPITRSRKQMRLHETLYPALKV